MSDVVWSIEGILTALAAGVGVFAVIAYVSRRSLMGGDGDRNDSQRLKPLVDLKKQTVEYPPGSGVRYLATIKDGELRSGLDPSVKTVYEAIRHGSKSANGGKGRCLGKRDTSKDGMPYVWLSYDEAIAQAESLAAGFRSRGIEPGEDSRVGIYAANCPEWVIAEQATYVYSMVNVPLYDTLGPDACSYIIKQADIHLVVAGSSDKALTLLEQDCPSLATLVLVESPTEALRARADERNVDLVTFEELVKDGATLKFKWPAEPPQPSQAATICYTSGTTGPPKGVVLTHANLVANTCCIAMMPNTNLTKDEVMISYLPLAHMFERLLETAMYTNGAQVGFYRGDVKLLTEDIKELRPTVFPTVPRLLNRIHDKICCKGTNVFREYFRDPEKTAEALDSEGWLHTGDIGQWTENGTLKIIDRKKHIFKLNQGEYVAPEKVENVYQGSKYVAQAFLYGDSFKSACVAIIVPDVETLPTGASKELGLPRSADLKELCENKDVKKMIMADMAAVAKKSGLHSFEQAKDVFLSAELWTVENGLLTPTFKSKRPDLLKVFKPTIDAMYKNID